MLHYPLAILKVTWSDTPWENGLPKGIPYDEALINRLYLPLEQHWGVAGFWRRGTFGQLNLEGSEVFPWRKLENMPAPTAWRDRADVVKKAIDQGLAEGWPLHEFKGIVVLVGPRSANQDGGGWTYGQWPNCLIQIGDDHHFCAHEMGHALTIEHTMGPHSTKPAPALDSYVSLYCVMGEGASAAPAALPPNGPPAGDGYWSTIAPLPAAANLCGYLPDFRDHPHHVEKAGPLTPAFKRTFRLRARDLSRSGEAPYPVAALIEVAGAPQPTERDAIPPAPPIAWVVELRRGAGWDRGFGTTGKPKEGMVVHSLRPINEFPGLNDFRPRAIYEGIIPLNAHNTAQLPWGGVSAGDADARFGNGALSVRVEEVAADLSWVEVTVGGSDLARQAAVFADFHPLGYEHERDEEGFAEGVPVFVCGKGDYHYTRSVRRQRIEGLGVAYGYDQPEFSWKINGEPVVMGPPYVINPNQLTVNVTSRIPLPAGGEAVTPGTATLEFGIGPTTLEVLGDSAAGNYDLEIEVTVREKSANAVNPAGPMSAVYIVKMENVVLTYEDAYYQALEACIQRVQDIDDRFSKSRRVGPQTRFRPTDSIERRITILNRIRENVVQEGHGVLAEQIGGVIAAMSQRLQR